MSFTKYIKKPVTKRHINPYLFLLLKRVIELEAVLHEAVKADKNNGQVPVTDKRKKPILTGIRAPIAVVTKFVIEQTNCSKQGESLAEFVRKSWSGRDFYFETWQLTEVLKLTKWVLYKPTWEDFERYHKGSEAYFFGETFANISYKKVWFAQKVTLEMMVEKMMTVYFLNFINKVYSNQHNLPFLPKTSDYIIRPILPNILPKGLEEIVRLPEYRNYFPSNEYVEVYAGGRLKQSGHA